MGDFFSSLRCGSSHHSINLMRADSDRHFHTAFEPRDESHMLTACDYLSLHGWKLLRGPSRHAIGHNLFIYPPGVERADHQIVRAARPDEKELGYFEPRPWHRDRPRRPKVRTPDPNAANYWGVGVPEEMLTSETKRHRCVAATRPRTAGKPLRRSKGGNDHGALP